MRGSPGAGGKITSHVARVIDSTLQHSLIRGVLLYAKLRTEAAYRVVGLSLARHWWF